MNKELNLQILALQRKIFGADVSLTEIQGVLADLMDILLMVPGDEQDADETNLDKLKDELDHATKLNTAYFHDLERHRNWLAEMNEKSSKLSKKLKDYETALVSIGNSGVLTGEDTANAQHARDVLKKWNGV